MYIYILILYLDHDLRDQYYHLVGNSRGTDYAHNIEKWVCLGLINSWEHIKLWVYTKVAITPV